MKVAQSCPTLCDPMDCIVCGVLQARIPEWVAFPFSRGSSQPRDWTQSPALQAVSFQLSHQGSPRILEWVAYLFSSRSSQPRNRTWVLWLSGYRICLQCGRPGFNPWIWKIPWRRERLPTLVFWPREFHGLYNPWGHKELDMTERLSLSLWVLMYVSKVAKN